MIQTSHHDRVIRAQAFSLRGPIHVSIRLRNPAHTDTLRWGHLRPAIALTSSLLALHPQLQITILLSGTRANGADDEYARYKLTPDQLARLRRIHFGPATPPSTPEKFFIPYEEIRASVTAIVKNFVAVYPKLLNVSVHKHDHVAPSYGR